MFAFLFYLFLLLLFLLIFTKLFLIKLLGIPRHKFSNLKYEEKKNIVQNNFNRIKNEKIKLKKYTNNIYKNRKNNESNLDLNFLNQIINIDLENKIAHVEGLITFESLLKETLRYNLIPKIVPEFKSLTVSGTISGLGIESSSFKYGLLPDIITEIEVILGTGEIVIANKKENTDIFYGFPNSYGTLGYILSAKIELIEAKKYVRTENILFKNSKDFINEIKKYDNFENPDNIDFLDGLILSTNEMYLIKGKMSDINIVNNSKYVSNYHYNIYYKSIINNKNDIMKLEDYIWRYDSNIFYSEGIVANKFFKYFMGDLLTTYNLKKIGEDFKKNLKKYFNLKIKSKKYKENVPNDLSISLTEFPSFLNWFNDNLGNYPVWICPYFIKNPYHFFNSDDKLELDFGINFGSNNGVYSTQEDKHYYKKLIDKKMYEMKKNKGLYPDIFLTENQFWELYDFKNKYFDLKKKCDPNNRFWNLYEKTVKNF